MEEDASAGQLVKYMSGYCKICYCLESTGAGMREQILRCTRFNSDLYQGIQADIKQTNNQGLLVFSLCCFSLTEMKCLKMSFCCGYTREGR